MAWVWSRQRIAVALTDAVVVIPTVLAVIGRIILGPGLGVHGAVCAQRPVVLAQEVDIEEVAGLVGTVRSRVIAVISRGGAAGGGTFAGIVDTGEILDANVRGWADGSVDGSTKLRRASVAVERTRGLLLCVALDTVNIPYDDKRQRISVNEDKMEKTHHWSLR